MWPWCSVVNSAFYKLLWVSSPTLSHWCIMLGITLISCITREKYFVADRDQSEIMHLLFWPDTLHRIGCRAVLMFICKRKYKMPQWLSVVLRVWSDVYFVAFSTPWNSNRRIAEKWMSALFEQLVTLMGQFSSEEKWKTSHSWYGFTAKVLTISEVITE